MSDSISRDLSGDPERGGYMGLLAMFREWTKKDELDGKDMGEPPDGFPIEDQEDVDAAAHLIGKAKDPEATKRRIIEICKRKGLDAPEGWIEDGSASMGGIGPVEHSNALVITPPVSMI